MTIFTQEHLSVQSFADQLELFLNDEAGHFPYDFKQDIIKCLTDIKDYSFYFSKIMQEVESLYSGKSTDDDFIENLNLLANEYLTQ